MSNWIHNRLPLRRIEAFPEVREGLMSGDGAGVEDGLDDGPDEGLSGDSPEPTPDDGLTDFQRQWLATEDPEPEPEPEEPDVSGWWEDVPAVRQFLLDGLDLGPATVLIGENGSGKSTVVEGIAMVYGFSPEGGSTGSRHRTRNTESGLHEQLHFIRNGGASKSGYFLRAETMHSFFSYLEDNPGSDPEEPLFHRLSHGESFVALIELRFRRPGFYVLDEPESALSFTNQLHLLRHLTGLMARGTHQFLMATHSPILAALPGADLYELDDAGFHLVDHDDARVVRQWREFLNAPAQFLPQG